jgi:hypothetical protein
MIARAGLGTAVMTLLMSVSLLSVGVSIGFVIAGGKQAGQIILLQTACHYQIGEIPA